jgi:hypothetical protein
MKDVLTKSATPLSTTDAYAAIGSTVESLASMAINAYTERKKKSDEFYASIIKYQQDYNLLLNEQLRINSQINSNVFFTDYAGKIKDATAALNDANQKYNEGLKKVTEGQAITGQKDVISQINVLTGAMAAGMVGAIVGLFSKKKADIVKPLLDVYPDLIKANGDFNEELAKTLIANNQVTDATKATLQNLIDWKAQSEAAREQLVGVIKDMAGTMGDDIRNGLVKAFEDGTSAAQAFGDSVNKVLENILSNMIFNAAFGPLLDKLQTNLFASSGLGPDGKTPLTGNPMKPDGTPIIDNSWTDDLLAFFKAAPPAIDMMNQGLEAAKKWGQSNGIDIFTGSSGSGTSQSAASTGAAISTMSQDSATALEGRFTALQMIGSDSLSLFKSIVPEIQAIRFNTGFLSGNSSNSNPVINITSDVSPSLSAIQVNTQITADTLKEQRNIALESMNHLADINKNTKQLYEMKDALLEIRKGTDTLKR